MKTAFQGIMGVSFPATMRQTKLRIKVKIYKSKSSKALDDSTSWQVHCAKIKSLIRKEWDLEAQSRNV